MTDYHVHIGQWTDGDYFYPQDVFAELKKRDVTETWFSSTTSCMFCKESERIKNDAGLKNAAPSARDLQNAIHEEIRGSVEVAAALCVKANALFWIVPDFFKSLCGSGVGERDGTSLSAILSGEFQKAPYKGFKIHPFAQDWNLQDEFTYSLASAVFSYANKNHLRILIHCGVDNCCKPEHFEQFIKISPDAIIQLAHARPAEKIIGMLEKYPNCVTDSAFVTKETLQKTREAGFADRIVYGSDFPVNKNPPQTI